MTIFNVFSILEPRSPHFGDVKKLKIEIIVICFTSVGKWSFHSSVYRQCAINMSSEESFVHE